MPDRLGLETAQQPLEAYWNVQGMAQNAVERIAVQVV